MGLHPSYIRARAYALRHAFHNDPVAIDPFVWFARRELDAADQQSAAEPIPHKACKTPSECRKEQVCFDPWACSCHAPDDQQSAAEPARDREPDPLMAPVCGGPRGCV